MTFVSIAIAYLLGSIPFGYLLTRLGTGQDVRTSGSGNIGATNVLRTAGKGLGIATLLLDAGKGTLAVWLAERASGSEPDSATLWMSLAALAVMLGHVFPVFLNFKGGKAVATFAGAFGYLLPMPLLATTLLFILIVAISHYVSAASIVGAATFPIAAWVISHPSTPEMLVSIFAGALIIYRHKSNIQRIRTGTESTFPGRK